MGQVSGLQLLQHFISSIRVQEFKKTNKMSALLCVTFLFKGNPLDGAVVHVNFKKKETNFGRVPWTSLGNANFFWLPHELKRLHFYELPLSFPFLNSSSGFVFSWLAFIDPFYIESWTSIGPKKESLSRDYCAIMNSNIDTTSVCWSFFTKHL